MTEADLCAEFIKLVDATGKWTCYAETAGFDILLVRKSDGIQIGIEAKLTLNNKVVDQAYPDLRWGYGMIGPDYRAVLVPRDKIQNGLKRICGFIGITVIMFDRSKIDDKWNPHLTIQPELPTGNSWDDEGWHDWMPSRRCSLPDYIPDVQAGCSAPVALTEWKIKAIKLAIILSERPVTRADFKALQISPSRWTDPWTGYLVKGDGGYVPGPRMPDFRTIHPVNFAQIEADKSKWMPLQQTSLEISKDA